MGDRNLGVELLPDSYKSPLLWGPTCVTQSKSASGHRASRKWSHKGHRLPHQEVPGPAAPPGALAPRPTGTLVPPAFRPCRPGRASGRQCGRAAACRNQRVSPVPPSPTLHGRGPFRAQLQGREPPTGDKGPARYCLSSRVQTRHPTALPAPQPYHVMGEGELTAQRRSHVTKVARTRAGFFHPTPPHRSCLRGVGGAGPCAHCTVPSPEGPRALLPRTHAQ